MEYKIQVSIKKQFEKLETWKPGEKLSLRIFFFWGKIEAVSVSVAAEGVLPNSIIRGPMRSGQQNVTACTEPIYLKGLFMDPVKAGIRLAAAFCRDLFEEEQGQMKEAIEELEKLAK